MSAIMGVRALYDCYVRTADIDASMMALCRIFQAKLIHRGEWTTIRRRTPTQRPPRPAPARRFLFPVA
jgi:hypothetical protein